MTTPNFRIQPRGPGFNPWKLLWAVPGLVLLVGILSTWYEVPADSVGVLLRFGKYQEDQQPGLHFKLPFGIDEVTMVPVKRQLKLEFGFASKDYTNPDQIGEDPEHERSMVTGDLSAALVEWVVQYRVDDPRLYLFHAREPGWTLRDLSEAVMREVIGDRTVDEVITIGRQEIESTALLRLRELAKGYQIGVYVDLLQLKNVNPPQAVQASFNEVNKAQQDRENMINIANGEYNKVVPKATGEAEQKLSEAEGYRLKRVNEARGDAAAFSAVLAEYVKAPEVTKTRIYLETMKEVLPQMRNTWVVDEKVTQLLPLMQGAQLGAPEVRK
jgi:membrane protease subunit HflK